MSKALMLGCTLLVLLTTLSAAQTINDGFKDCPTTTNISALDLSAEPYRSCTLERCESTTGATPTGITPDGQCDGTGNTEATSSDTCDNFLAAYRRFYACVMNAASKDPNAPESFREALIIYDNTPGAPLHLSNIVCEGCVNFNAVFRETAVPATCRAAADCSLCCGQNPTTQWFGTPGKGYNHVLCGSGCITAILMSAFTLLFAVIFASCGCCWPSPSLRTTVEQLQREDKAGRAKAVAMLSSDDELRNDRGENDGEERNDEDVNNTTSNQENQDREAAQHEPVQEHRNSPDEM